MKRIAVIAGAAALLMFAGCDRNKTLRIADFTVTYPSDYEVMSQQDNFPDDAAVFFQGPNGEVGMNTVVYYANDELDLLEDLYGELPSFIENKVDELLGKLCNGAIISDLTVEDATELEWLDDLCAGLRVCGTRGEEESEWEGGIIIYLENGALVTSLALGANSDQVNALLDIAQGFVFDPHEESYQPQRETLLDEFDEFEEEEE